MGQVSPKTKAAALADLHAGEQPAVVAERYGLDPAVVRVWKSRYITHVAVVVAHDTVRKPVVEQQQSEIGTLVIDLLAAKLKASAAIAKATEDTTWMGKQSAAELAEFGAWLDSTAFAIGDRLAGRSQQPTESDD